jgi:hypothetical protein
MQFIASLRSCHSQKSGAETASRQKHHAAAAATVVTAAKLRAGKGKDEQASAQGVNQQLGCALTSPAPTYHD